MEQYYCGVDSTGQRPEDIRKALMENQLSMPAEECGMLLGILPEMIKKCWELGAWVG